jgi:hypothetical protein
LVEKKKRFPFLSDGVHGYLNSESSMHPFFIAFGPRFKQNANVTTFSIVDIYPLMCEILGVEPGPNNGSLANVAALLLDPKSSVGKRDPQAAEYNNSNKCVLETDGSGKTSGSDTKPPLTWDTIFHRILTACK